MQSILRAFYRRHYSPSAMKLVVVGPQSLAELEQAVLAAAGDWQTEPVAAEEVGILLLLLSPFPDDESLSR